MDEQGDVRLDALLHVPVKDKVADRLEHVDQVQLGQLGRERP